MTAEEMFTASEIAAWLRCSVRKVTDVAKAHGLGADLGGRAGWRFTATDKAALYEALRPAIVQPIRRRKRAS